MKKYSKYKDSGVEWLGKGMHSGIQEGNQVGIAKFSGIKC